ncbi:hypothetical protein [Deinococcus planocerae]|uniref:hypothetical protein n=1 Tax=Deinococcus planocerae TaxID=1737569 RepID=UPI0015E1002F|nr:hypothetical protein [Deinococcus planocerae]
MGNVWTCRARKVGAAFPTFLGKDVGIELLNWQVSGTVLLQGRVDLVTAWATANDYTKPQHPLPGIYLVDAETLFYVSARGLLVTSAADVVRSMSPSPKTTGQLSEAAACEVLVGQKRVFVLSDLSSFQIKKLLLDLFGIRTRPTDTLRFP